MTKKIIAFRRKDDGELFTLNEDGVTFSAQKMKDDFPDSHRHSWDTNAFLPLYDDFEPIYSKLPWQRICPDKDSTDKDYYCCVCRQTDKDARIIREYLLHYSPSMNRAWAFDMRCEDTASLRFKCNSQQEADMLREMLDAQFEE